MSQHTKIRKRISFTPIMLSKHPHTQPPSPSDPSTAQDLKPYANNARPPVCTEPTMIYQVACSERAFLSRHLFEILTPCLTLIIIVFLFLFALQQIVIDGGA